VSWFVFGGSTGSQSQLLNGWIFIEYFLDLYENRTKAMLIVTIGVFLFFGIWNFPFIDQIDSFKWVPQITAKKWLYHIFAYILIGLIQKAKDQLFIIVPICLNFWKRRKRFVYFKKAPKFMHILRIGVGYSRQAFGRYLYCAIICHS